MTSQAIATDDDLDENSRPISERLSVAELVAIYVRAEADIRAGFALVGGALDRLVASMGGRGMYLQGLQGRVSGRDRVLRLQGMEEADTPPAVQADGPRQAPQRHRRRGAAQAGGGWVMETKQEWLARAMPLNPDGSIRHAASGVDVPWIHSDGGRAAAGRKGDAGDCVTRAIAIATGRPYGWVYDEINAAASTERPRTKKRSSARTGVHRRTYQPYIESLGWTWTPTMEIGSGCKVHLRPDELPRGRLIVSLSRHLCAVIDGVIHDTSDPSRAGTRCVYGYFAASPAIAEINASFARIENLEAQLRAVRTLKEGL